jgi:hypothetical protein
METEQLENFNERLSQWVANQGFWFQVRYSLSGSGMKGRAMFHLLRLGFRVLMFLVLLAVVAWIYLVKRTDSKVFVEGMREELQTGLSASDMELRGFSRVQGQLEISRLAAEGGNETFFTSLEVRNVRCKMGLLDGLTATWNPGIVTIARLDLDLRAGTDDADSAHKLAEAVFRKPGKVHANAFDVASASLRWGYSERTQGAIEGSNMKMQRVESGWRMSFKGGMFYQNWLRGLQIVEITALCQPDGIVFETAKLKDGQGTVDFSGLRVSGGERPQVQGVAKIRRLSLERILPTAVRNFIEGSISGDFRVFGSTNSTDGIGFDGQVVMDGDDLISLRERIHLLKALSVVDYSRNYHRVDFREGSFQMKTVSGGVELSDVKLAAEDLFTLEGNLTVRLPTQEEIQAAVAKGSGLGGSPIFSDSDVSAEDRELSQTKSDFSLKRAALEAKRVKEGQQSPDSLNLFDRLGLSFEMRQLQNQASDRMSRMLQYEGELLITIPHDAFERAGHLQKLYPVDPTTNRVPIRVPIEGHLYELTLKQAEDIYQQGRR